MHPGLPPFPSGDRHLHVFRQEVKGSDEVTGYIGGNGKYRKRGNRVPFLEGSQSTYRGRSFELAFSPLASFYPVTKEYTEARNPPSRREDRQ